MGCCLWAVIGTIWPRVALVFLYFVTDIPQKAFETRQWPLLGFFFLPTTTLAYALCRFYGEGPIENNIWYLAAVFAALLYDLGLFGSLGRRRRQ